MACNDSTSRSAEENTTEEQTQLASCYPTGCPPCTDEISFPENPSDGQEYCISLGTDGDGEPELKCWVYDHCIPGWRARGPKTSPLTFKGSIDICTVDPPLESLNGDYYIISTDCSDSSRITLWKLTAPVKAGDRIVFNGSTWEYVLPPYIPYTGPAEKFDLIDPDADGRREYVVGEQMPTLTGPLKCSDTFYGAIVTGTYPDYTSFTYLPEGSDEGIWTRENGVAVLNPELNLAIGTKLLFYCRVDNRQGGIVKLATGVEVGEGASCCNVITPCALREGLPELIKDIDLDIPSIDTDSCPATVGDEGPEAVAYIAATNQINCKTLREGTTSYFGVGQIAPNYSNDRDTYGDGYDSDWLTNAALAPVLDGIIRRLEEIEQGNTGTPVAPVVVNLTGSGTWTAVDPDNLVGVTVVLGSGSGGAAIAGAPPEISGIYQGGAGSDGSYYRVDMTVEESGTSAPYSVGGGGRGGWNEIGSGNDFQCPTSGGDTSFTPSGTQTLLQVGGGRGGQNSSRCVNSSNPVQGTNINVTENVTNEYPRIPGGRFVNVNTSCEEEGGCTGTASADGGVSGRIIVYERYPSGWSDPRNADGGFSL